MAQLRCQAARFHARPQHDGKRGHRSLQKRLVDFRIHLRPLGVVLHVAHHSHNLAPYWRSILNVQLNLFPERIAILKIAVHKFLVHHHHPRRVPLVHLRQRATAQQRNPRHLKVILAHNHIPSRALLVRSRCRLPLDANRNAVRSRRRKIRSHRPVLDTRNALQARHQVAHKLDLLRRIAVACMIQRHTRSQQMIPSEPQLLMLQHQKSVDQQTAPNQQKQRQRDFTAHQQGAQAAMRAARRSSPALALQVRIDVGVRGLQRRNQARQQRRCQRDANSKQQDIPVQTHGNRADRVVEGQARAKVADSEMRQQQANPAARQRDHQPFRHQLPHHAHPARAQ